MRYTYTFTTTFPQELTNEQLQDFLATLVFQTKRSWKTETPMLLTEQELIQRENEMLEEKRERERQND